MIKYKLFALFCLISFNVKGKTDSTQQKLDKNNSIIISVSNFSFPKILRFRLGISRNLFDQCGIYYERRIYKQFKATIGYSEWNTLIHEGARPFVPGYIGLMTIGSFQYRQHYKMADIFLSYKYRKCIRHSIDVGIGASYYWGLNTYIDTIFYNPDPPYDAIEYSKSRKENYWGIVPFVKYDYLLWKNRIGLGADIRLRKYFGLNSAQIDYGIHLSLNF